MGIYGAAALFPLPPVRAVVKCPWNISANSSPSIIFVFRMVVSGSSFSLGIGYIPRYGEFEAFFDRVEHVRSSNNTRVLREVFDPRDFVVICLDFSDFSFFLTVSEILGDCYIEYKLPLYCSACGFGNDRSS